MPHGTMAIYSHSTSSFYSRVFFMSFLAYAICVLWLKIQKNSRAFPYLIERGFRLSHIQIFKPFLQGEHIPTIMRPKVKINYFYLLL